MHKLLSLPCWRELKLQASYLVYASFCLSTYALHFICRHSYFHLNHVVLFFACCLLSLNVSAAALLFVGLLVCLLWFSSLTSVTLVRLWFFASRVASHYHFRAWALVMSLSWCQFASSQGSLHLVSVALLFFPCVLIRVCVGWQHDKFAGLPYVGVWKRAARLGRVAFWGRIAQRDNQRQK